MNTRFGGMPIESPRGGEHSKFYRMTREHAHTFANTVNAKFIQLLEP